MKFAITICPDDSKQFTNAPNRLQSCVNWMRLLLHKHIDTKTTQYELYVEVSHPETTQDGRNARIHYHGTISFNEITSRDLFYIKTLHRLNRYTRIEIKDLKDETEWLNYCTKDQGSMYYLCHNLGTHSCITSEMPPPSSKAAEARSSNGAWVEQLALEEEEMF